MPYGTVAGPESATQRAMHGVPNGSPPLSRTSRRLALHLELMILQNVQREPQAPTDWLVAWRSGTIDLCGHFGPPKIRIIVDGGMKAGLDDPKQTQNTLEGLTHFELSYRL